MNSGHRERAGGDREIHTYCRGKPTFSVSEKVPQATAVTSGRLPSVQLFKNRVTVYTVPRKHITGHSVGGGTLRLLGT